MCLSLETTERTIRVLQHCGNRHIWSGINGGTLSTLRYRDEIPDPIVRPFAGTIGDNFILMQDNAGHHTARVYMDYFNREAIEVMDWPQVLRTFKTNRT